MKGLVAAAVSVSVLSLILSIIALASGGADNGGTQEKLDALARDIESLKQKVDGVASERDGQVRTLGALKARIEDVSSRTGQLREAIDELSSREPKVAAAQQQPQVDEEAIRRVMRDMFRQRMEQARAAGGQRGQQGQQRQARERVTADKLSDTVKTAAAGAVEGFQVDHAHPAGTTPEGVAVFDVDGSVNGRNYRVKVTAEGKVLESSERQSRRGRRGRPGGRGNDAPAAAPQDAPEAF